MLLLAFQTRCVHGAGHGGQRGRLRLQVLLLYTLVAIMFLLVHSRTLKGPVFICFMRHNVRGLRYIHELRPRTIARSR